MICEGMGDPDRTEQVRRGGGSERGGRIRKGPGEDWISTGRFRQGRRDQRGTGCGDSDRLDSGSEGRAVTGRGQWQGGRTVTGRGGQWQGGADSGREGRTVTGRGGQ